MPAILPVPNIRSQIERAVRAWLFDCDVAALPQFFLSHDYRQRAVYDKDKNQVPLIEIIGVSAVESIKNSRIETWQLRIDPEWGCATQPDDPNPNFNWVQINRLVGLIMAAMSITSNGGANYTDTALGISVMGRRLAMLGSMGDPENADDLANNSDMASFYCDFVEYTGAMGAGIEGGALVFKERRNFQIRAGNLDDDSIFPALEFDSAHTLNWTFTAGSVPEPAQWNVEKSVDGRAWVTQEILAAGSRASSSIAGTGTQYWRITRTDAAIAAYMPESNIVKAVAL